MCNDLSSVSVIGFVGVGIYPDGDEFVFVPNVKTLKMMRSPSIAALSRCILIEVRRKKLDGIICILKIGFNIGKISIKRLPKKHEADFVVCYNGSLSKPNA